MCVIFLKIFSELDQHQNSDYIKLMLLYRQHDKLKYEAWSNYQMVNHGLLKVITLGISKLEIKV